MCTRLFFSGILLSLVLVSACQSEPDYHTVDTSDIDLFWKAYDVVSAETDSARQVALLDSLYIQSGTLGLQKIITLRDYTASEYVKLFNQYPKYWESLRPNTLRSKDLAAALETGIEQLRDMYPALRPATIYFTVGAMRTNGTTRDSTVLIGAELAMGDSTVDISEFEGDTYTWLEGFFGTDPSANIVLLNVHEYVHTQQPEATNLRHFVLREGVAEFLSCLAMGVPSVTPAVAFGKANPAVKEAFEDQMFYERTYQWLWSSANNNEFGVRDLGYSIGYDMAEQYYNAATNKEAAFARLIELDYQNEAAVDAFIDELGFFSKPLATLQQEDEAHRPSVLGISQFENGAVDVSPNLQEITIEFSEPLNGYNTGVDYGPDESAKFPSVDSFTWASDGSSWTLLVALEPNTHYQLVISANFRTAENIPLLPMLIDFTTSE